MIDSGRFDTRFGGLAAGLEQSELESLVRRLRLLEVNAGEVLITEGTPTSGLHLLWEGTLEVSVGVEATPLATLEPGQYVGEVSLLDPGPASATVCSEAGATVLELMREDLASFEAEYPRAAATLLHELARVVAQRIRGASRELAAAGIVSPAPVSAGDSAEALPGAANPSHFRPGELLGSGGRRAPGAYVLRSGRVLRRSAPTEGSVPLLALPSGGLVGAEALVGAVLATDLIAVTDVEAVLLPTGALGGLDDAQGLALQRAVAGELARELRALTTLKRGMAPKMPETATTDVAVIGGGVIGLAYATFVKEARPQAAVTVLERRSVPGYKVGESTLSTTTRAMRRMGLNYPVMRRLFGIKSGIRFWWTGPDDPALHRHIDVVDIDETFQVERRVLETALIETARRRGIDVRMGGKVDVARSDIGAERSRLACQSPEGPVELRAHVVCDASGPAALLTRRFGMHRRAPERLGTFNTNAYYAYFRQRSDVPLDHWEEPATRHICFPEGWCWYITVTSWEDTPQENLEAMIRALLDHPDGPDESYPARRELEERFGCSSEPILSVGFTVRDDLDETSGMPLAERFQHYRKRYPTIDWVLDHYELVETPYGKKPYSAFLNLAHDSSAVAGDGWCAVGDAAGFTNPLFSPGLTYGTGMAYEAAQDTVRALASRDTSHGSFRAYQHYAERIHAILMAFNDMLYRSFRSDETFERALAMFLYHAVGDVLERDEYSETDPYVWEILNPEFTRRVDEVRRVLRTAEERDTDTADVIREVRGITDPYIREVLQRPEMQALDLRPVLRGFDDEGQLAGHRHTEPGAFAATRCGQCRLYLDASLESCPVCGTPNAAVAPA